MRYQRDFEDRVRRYPAAYAAGRYAGQPSGFGRDARPRYDGRLRGNPNGGYGRDYWWMGERAMPPQGFGGRYDTAYHRFSERTHPRYSPVGGMRPGRGAGFDPRRPPRPARENVWFSDWTRWF